MDTDSTDNKKENSTQSKSSDKKVRWFNSLQYQLSIRAILILILAISGINAIIILVVKDYLVAAEEKSINQIALSLVKDVEKITNSTESLTKAIASVSESLPKQESLFKLTIPDIIENSNIAPLVAGGGIWPEEYQFDPTKKRRSFFWAKNQSGKLHYMDQYNSLEGNGYHNEEWYVPVKQKPGKNCYWSESYQDPFSLEAMITCSIPVKNKALEFAGVATIDVKLSELTGIVNTTSRLFKGYAFIVDRNNRFISFPDLLEVTKKEIDLTGAQSQELLSVNSFAELHPSFSSIAQQLESVNKRLIKEVSKKDNEKLLALAESFSFNSYQIGEQQALLSAALLIK
ncbi:MAG: cache domain-containing protein, partial [Kangiellaceae bacterium]|nr:cache domain-containing protein [Kangiellaceae bacterium]